MQGKDTCAWLTAVTLGQPKANVNKYARLYPKKRPKSYCTVWCNEIYDNLRWLFGYQCVQCHAKFKGNNCDFVHVKPTALSGKGDNRGKFRRVKDILDNPDCYTYMCTNCHWDFDHNSNEAEKAKIIALVPTVLDRLHTVFKLLV